jgi:hypothetical protein
MFIKTLQKFIRCGNIDSAIEISQKISDEKLFANLLTILFEDIGLANVPLIKEFVCCDPPTDIVKKMAISPKSKLCSYMSYNFKLSMLDISHKVEPFPSEQYKMLDFSNSNYSFEYALRVAGMMYFKGMDEYFWNLIMRDLTDNAEIEFLYGIRNMFVKFSHKEPISWCFVLLWKYAVHLESENCNDLKWVPMHPSFNFSEKVKTSENSWACFAKDFKNSNKEPYPLWRSGIYCKNSEYFYVKSEENDDVDKICDMLQMNLDKTIYTTDIRVSSICGNHEVVKEHKIKDSVRAAKYTYESLLETYSKKIFPHFTELGTLQLSIAKNVPDMPKVVIYCWLKNSNGKRQRYVLKPFTSRAIANGVSSTDKLMNKYKFGRVPWCKPSVIIGLTGFVIYSPVDNCIRIKEGRTYYTISEALPYFLPVPVGLEKWSSSPVVDKIILVGLLKYIFGISDRTIHNVGVYVNSRTKTLEICSFDHSPPLTELDGPIFGKNVEKYLQNPKKFTKERAWLKTLTVEAEYFVRLSEVLTAISVE